MLNYSDLDEELLMQWFPELEERIFTESELSINLPHCLYADVLNPVVKDYLRYDNTGDPIMLNRIFDFFEYLASEGDAETKNLLQVSLLEALWEEHGIYKRACDLMGPHTRQINDNIRGYMKEPLI